MAQVTAEIESLQEQIKEKRTKLERLNDEKAEEDQKQLMAAGQPRGKTIGEIIEMINRSVL